MAERINPTKEEILSNLAIGKERLEAAKLLLEGGFYRDSISRSYYAFLDAANAALLSKDVIAKSHSGNARLFSLHFIKEGVVDKKYGRWLRKALKARMEADYERGKTFSEQEAAEALGEAEEFLTMIEWLIRKILKA